MNSVRIPAQAVQLRHLGPQVTARSLGGITCVVSPSAPGSPNPGDLWIDSASSYQLSQWSGSSWFAVPVNAGSLTGSNFIISAAGQFYYDSPPALTDWDFGDGLQGWAGTNATLAQSGAQVYSGLYSALLTYTSGTSWSAASPPVAVTAGAQAFASAWVYAPQALGAVGIGFAWYNSGGALISTSSDTTAALGAGAWTQLAYNGTAPASTAFVSVIVQDLETSTTGYQLFVDDAWLGGSLAVSITPAGGNDPLGNSCPSGVAALGPAGQQVRLSADTAGVPWLEFVSGIAAESGHGRLQVQGLGSGSTGTLALYVVPPTVTGQTEYPNILLASASPDGTVAAAGVLGWATSATNTLDLTWNGSVITTNVPLLVSAGAQAPASSLTGGIIISQVDNAFTSQTNPTSPSRVCKAWPIPAGDPAELTVYRLSTFGGGTWEGNPLSFQIAAFGEALAAFTVGGAAMSSGLSFAWDLEAKLVISQTGTSGILTGSIRLNLGQSVNNQLSGGGVNGSGGFGGLSVVEPVSGIGAASSSMTVQASFASSSSSQVIESFGSIFERIGGQA